ncbi:MAG: cytochrome c-type biogenesis protein CcmH [bacterium]
MISKKIIFTVLLFSIIFPVRNTVFAVSVEEMMKELKCPKDQESLEHQHGCPEHKEMLSLLEQLVKDGKTKDEILNIFADKFGPESLVNVQMKGFGLLSYLVPISGLFLVFILIFIIIKKWVKREEKIYQHEQEMVNASSDFQDYDIIFEEEYEKFKKEE